jgi:putative intracellular protease/amidase
MYEIQDVHLFVLDTLADWEPGLAIAHINQPAPGVSARYRVRTVGLDRALVHTRGGVAIQPDLTLAELTPSRSAALILPGSYLWEDPRTDPALERARAFVEAGVPVAAICGGTFGLARAGLLDDRRHTSNDPRFLEPSGYRGAAHYVRELAVEDRGVITAAASASLEFARLLLARLRVFPPAALDAWYALFKTHDPACYFAFAKALEADAAPQPGR